jgi:uracil phosphoribosyltransferase
MYRAKDSYLPVQYYNRLPKNQQCDVAFVVDPCIATANTVHAVVSILKRWGAKRIVVIAAIASLEGINKLSELHPTIDIFVGATDETIDENGMIFPGLGDAGDRLFGTPNHEIPVLLPTEPISPLISKRKKETQEDKVNTKSVKKES